ncbi:uncharacterized protein LOC124671484 [Lolium rigidum]|uniref:uncharacterized protein LOC124671484 n=1 Tax=Lolium rigidum TaxID=89674 RepID=UPI001F5C360A|nr:uncharacterized protein LOC124671484 [Lolium rigidum]
MDAAAAAAVSTLSALAVFVSTVHNGAVRSAHGYKVVGRREWERWVEREFAFSPTACREVPLPVGSPRILPTDWRGRPVYREGQLVGPWRCILAFDSVAGVAPPPTLPPLLSPSGNARLICCVPSLYNDLLKLFPFQKLQKVPEPIRCDSDKPKTPVDTKHASIPKKVLIQRDSDKQKTPLDAKDNIISNKKVHTEPIQCDSCEQKPPLDTNSHEQGAPLDTKDDIIPKKVHTELIQCDSDGHKTPLDTKDNIISKKAVHTELVQCDTEDPKTPLDRKDTISKMVHSELIQCDADEHKAPLDSKGWIPTIKVQPPGSDSAGRPRIGQELPTPVQKQRRAQREYIASLTLGDIAQYFHLPIREASRTLRIGLSILKKKCRQYGIPRWPHRKIKSLDSLIQDLEYVLNDTEKDGAEQEEHTEKEDEKDDAMRSLAKRKRQLETEMATIHQKPTLDLMNETKQFRQFVFKRRYKAKHLAEEE